MFDPRDRACKCVAVRSNGGLCILDARTGWDDGIGVAGPDDALCGEGMGEYGDGI
jgi:hypothetical protein